MYKRYIPSRSHLYHLAIFRSITKKVEYHFTIFRSTTEKAESCRTCNNYLYFAVIDWCRDKDGLNCWLYVDAKCEGFYEDWARENCPYRCGYCPSMQVKVILCRPKYIGQKHLTYTYPWFTFNRSNSFIIQDKRKKCMCLLKVFLFFFLPQNQHNLLIFQFYNSKLNVVLFLCRAKSAKYI